MKKAIFVFGAVTLAAFASAGDAYRFSIHKATDEMTQHTADTYLLPQGWKANDTVKWTLLQQDSPLLVAHLLSSPDNLFSINYINCLAHWYTRLPASSAAKSGGVPPPADPADVITGNFQQQHPGMAYEMVEHKETPIASVFRPAPTMTTTAMRCQIKLKFELNGAPTLAEYAFDYQAYDSGTAWGRRNGFSNGHWYLYNLTSVSGPADQFEKAMKLGVVTLSSIREDPLFYEFKESVFNALTQQMIDNTNEQLKARFDQMKEYFKGLSERNRAQFEQEQQRKDDFTRGMVDFALDRSRYTDGQNVFLVPNTTDRVLTNGEEIVLETGPQYQMPGHWDEMKKID